MIVTGLSDAILGLTDSSPALGRAGIGVWQWNAVNDEAYLCRGMAEIFGFPRDEAQETHRLADMIDHIHPDDRPRVSLAAQEASQRGGPCVLRYRTFSTIGGVRDVLCNAWYNSAFGAEPPGARGVVVDLSKRISSSGERAGADPLDRLARHALAAWAELSSLEAEDQDALEPSLRALLMLVGRRTALQAPIPTRLLS